MIEYIVFITGSSTILECFFADSDEEAKRLSVSKWGNQTFSLDRHDYSDEDGVTVYIHTPA
jgi:hypothetical protein